MTPGRVLLVSSSSGSHGGGEFYLIGLAQGLTALGWEVATVMSVHPRMDGLAGRLAEVGRVERTPLIVNTYDRSLRSLAALAPSGGVGQVAELIRRLSPDVVHVNKQNFEDGLDLLAAADRSRKPAVCTVHVTRPMRELGGVLAGPRDWVARRALGRASCEFVAIAHTCRQQMVAFLNGRVTDDRLHAVPNGVGPAPAGSSSGVRAEWGYSSGDVVLGCVARMEAQKNPLFLLDVLAQLPSHVRLVWVGDGQLRAEFEAKVASLGLGGRVHLDGWRADARTRMVGFDLFVLPSSYEGFPFAVLEAMAAALPCVVSDVDGTREAVTDGETGWLCAPGELAAWVRKLKQVVADPLAREQVGQGAVARYRERFSLEAMARGTASVYEVARRRAAGGAA